jgi:hypothetical protein
MACHNCNTAGYSADLSGHLRNLASYIHELPLPLMLHAASLLAPLHLPPSTAFWTSLGIFSMSRTLLDAVRARLQLHVDMCIVVECT